MKSFNDPVESAAVQERLAIFDDLVEAVYVQVRSDFER